jgi:hypothetical protein
MYVSCTYFFSLGEVPDLLELELDCSLRTYQHGLSAISRVFFSHNKSANNTFQSSFSTLFNEANRSPEHQVTTDADMVPWCNNKTMAHTRWRQGEA